MTTPTDEELLAKIKAFLAEVDMKPTRFGRDALGEAGFVASVEDGRSPSLKKWNRAFAWIDAYRAARGSSDHVAANAPDAAPLSVRNDGEFTHAPAARREEQAA